MEPGSTPVAARTRSSLNSFDNLLSRLPDNHNNHEHGKIREHVVDNLTRFKIWAGSIGAYHVDNRSADHRLREAPEIRQRLLELLDEVVEANEDLLAMLAGGRVDQITEGHANGGLIEICRCVRDCISSLLKVSALLGDATGRDRFIKAVASNEPAFLEEFDIRHVECKYPKVSRSPRLAERLGRANVLRRQYLRDARKHHDRLAHDPVRPMRPDAVPTGATNTLSVSGIEQETSTSSRPTASTLTVDRLPQDEPGGFDVENLEETRSQASSVVSSNTSYREREGLEVIPLSEVSKDGQPFECPYCYTIIQSQCQRSWKRHVLRDIQAWACTFSDCSFGLFKDRESWFGHELEYHRRQWECLSCAGAKFGSSAEMEGHLVQYHPAISTGALPRVIAASSRPLTVIPASACPLCDEWEHHLKKQRSSPEPATGVEVTVPTRVFEQHLSRHLVQLALFSVPLRFDGALNSKSTEPGKNVGALEEWQNGVEAMSEVSEQGSFDSSEVAQPDGNSDEKANATLTQTNDTNPGIEVQGSIPPANDQFSSEAPDFSAYHKAEPSLQGRRLPDLTLPLRQSKSDLSGIARVVGQCALDAKHLGLVCATLSGINEAGYASSALAQCRAIVASFGESFQSMPSLIAQGQRKSEDCVGDIDANIECIIVQSFIWNKIQTYRWSVVQAREHLISMQLRLATISNMAPAAQLTMASMEEALRLKRERQRSFDLTEPPPDPSSTLPELTRPEPSTSQSAQTLSRGPDFRHLADVLASQAKLLKGFAVALDKC